MSERSERQRQEVASKVEETRNLGLNGTWDDLPGLVAQATGDKCPSVRLLAAAAAADLVGRLRGSLTDAQRAELVKVIGLLDPGVNPSLLIALAPAETAGLDRVGRILRDGRTEVRAGASAALRRMVLSTHLAHEAEISARVGVWLSERIAPDAAVELAKLAGEAGWPEHTDRIARLSRTGRTQGPSIEEALQHLALRTSIDTWAGWWVSEGTDVLEVGDATPDPDGGLVIASGAIVGEGPLVLEAGRATSPRKIRMVWAPRLGESGRFPALITDGKVFWKQDGTAMARLAEDAVARMSPEKAGILADWLAPVDGVTGTRARAAALVVAGRAAEALPLLEDFAEKKPKPETWYWLARARKALGDAAGARAAAAQYLEKAPKKGEFRAELEALTAGR
jgi:hypothetical protein